MKTAPANPDLLRARTRDPRRRGFIMLALLVIVTMMLFYVTASSRTLYQLQRELAAVERAQVKRLAHSPPAATGLPGGATNERVQPKTSVP